MEKGSEGVDSSQVELDYLTPNGQSHENGGPEASNPLPDVLLSGAPAVQSLTSVEEKGAANNGNKANKADGDSPESASLYSDEIPSG